MPVFGGQKIGRYALPPSYSQNIFGGFKGRPSPFTKKIGQTAFVSLPMKCYHKLVTHSVCSTCETAKEKLSFILQSPGLRREGSCSLKELALFPHKAGNHSLCT